MKILNIILLLCILCVSFPIVYATDYDKQVFPTINNCYNVSFIPHLKYGTPVPYSFPGCTKTDGRWYCDCYNKGGFNLTIRSDDNVSNKRLYSIDITYNTVSYHKFKGETLFLDHGTWVSQNEFNNVITEDVPMCEPQFIYNNTKEYVYINQTVYLDRNVTIERIIEVNHTVYVNQTVPMLYIGGKQAVFNNYTINIDNRNHWYEFWRGHTTTNIELR